MASDPENVGNGMEREGAACGWVKRAMRAEQMSDETEGDAIRKAGCELRAVLCSLINCSEAKVWLAENVPDAVEEADAAIDAWDDLT